MTQRSNESPQSSMLEDNPIKQPPCSEWNVWIGTEVEGNEDIGAATLFIRNLYTADTQIILSPGKIFERALSMGIRRVWFCEGFWQLPIIVEATERFDKVCWCMDITDQRAQTHPKYISADHMNKVRIYLKIGSLFPLRPGDFVCFGEKYADTAYQLVGGSDVTTELYEEDVRWY